MTQRDCTFVAQAMPTFSPLVKIGDVRVGTTTRAAIERFERTGRTAADRAPDPSEAGNGTLMWLAPVAMVARDDLGRAVELAIAQSRTTHGAPVAHEACVLLVTLLVEALSGRDRDTVLRPRPFAGALYGREGSPDPWLHRLAWRDRIEALAERLIDAGRG